ncbi:MAG TPA: hypothetical protein VJP41_09400 [Gaiellaceae bacterium]|nr:hypothetical protein [Gaiellaceae bacterium]
MSLLRERTTGSARPLPDEAVLSEPERSRDRRSAALRILGAIAVLVVGAVHLQQYVSGYSSVRIIGPLFLLNFGGATVIGLGLLVPLARAQVLHVLLGLGGIGLAGTSFVFLFVSEHQPLFGFEEHGYRLAIVLALVAEAVAVGTLGAYLAGRARSRSRR